MLFSEKICTWFFQVVHTKWSSFAVSENLKDTDSKLQIKNDLYFTGAVHYGQIGRLYVRHCASSLWLSELIKKMNCTLVTTDYFLQVKFVEFILKNKVSRSLRLSFLNQFEMLKVLLHGNDFKYIKTLNKHFWALKY